MNVFSLFDGISTCYYVLKKMGISVENYYASEIEQSAMAISRYNFGDKITQLGDVTKIDPTPLIGKIDLMTWGSPCVDFTIIKNKREGLKGKGSGLYLNALDLYHTIKPKYFFMENVQMTQDWEDIITNDLGVKPIYIDSDIISGAHRPRLYWTNIPVLSELHGTHPTLGEFLQKTEEVADKYWYRDKEYDYISDTANVQCIMHFNCHEMGKRVFNPNGVCGTLTTVRGGYNEKKVYQNGTPRKLTPIEYERLQGLPDNYTKYGIYDNSSEVKVIADSKRYSACGNGWTVGVIEHLFGGLRNG